MLLKLSTRDDELHYDSTRSQRRNVWYELATETWNGSGSSLRQHWQNSDATVKVAIIDASVTVEKKLQLRRASTDNALVAANLPNQGAT
jgi:hypothetical protein